MNEFVSTPESKAIAARMSELRATGRCGRWKAGWDDPERVAVLCANKLVWGNCPEEYRHLLLDSYRATTKCQRGECSCEGT